MDDAQRRGMWAGRIEQCLDSRMTIREWCELSKVSKSSLYKWMARFREEEPSRFSHRSSEATNWIKVTAGGIAKRRSSRGERPYVCPSGEDRLDVPRGQSFLYDRG